MSDLIPDEELMSLADEAGTVFDEALARQEAKPLNGRATPQQVGYFEAGFNAGALWERARRPSPVTREALADAIEAAGTDWNYRLSENLPTRPLADEVADAVFDLLSVSPPAEVTDETAEQATLYGYQAVWDDGKFDADPVKNAWMWERVQIAVRATVERALGVPVSPESEAGHDEGCADFYIEYGAPENGVCKVCGEAVLSPERGE